jgi:hypothetical protein
VEEKVDEKEEQRRPFERVWEGVRCHTLGEKFTGTQSKNTTATTDHLSDVYEVVTEFSLPFFEAITFHIGPMRCREGGRNEKKKKKKKKGFQIRERSPETKQECVRTEL